MHNCAIVILAAGSSSRFGSPKQLLAFNDKNLLNHSLDAALGTGCQAVYAVLGANRDLMWNELKDKPVIMVENTGWQEGMASSIRCGVEKIMNTLPCPDFIIFMVCDQPYVSSSLLVNLLEKNKETGMSIVGSSYGDTIGTPALFHKNFFPALLELRGDRGARKLIINNPDQVTTVPFPEGIINIDTASDYEMLKRAGNN